MRWRAEVNKLQGVDSEVIGPDEIARLVPFMDVSEHTRYPILGALYHPPGGTIRHDAVNWGYARAADAMGVDIHQQTEVVGIDVVDGQVAGVTTTRGHIATPVVVNCTAGWSSLVSAMAGVGLPIATHPLEAAVTEPVKPFLATVVVSGTLHVYVSQTDRGELVFGASTDSIVVLDARVAGLLRGAGRTRLELMPSLAKLRVLRQWAGLCDLTPDFSPIMGSRRWRASSSTSAGGRTASRPGRWPGSDGRADRHGQDARDHRRVLDLARSPKAASSERRERRPSATEPHRCPKSPMR